MGLKEFHLFAGRGWPLPYVRGFPRRAAGFFGRRYRVLAQQRVYGYDDYPTAGRGELDRNVLTDLSGVLAGTNGEDRNR